MVVDGSWFMVAETRKGRWRMTAEVLIVVNTVGGLIVVFGIGFMTGRMTAEVKTVWNTETKIGPCDGSCLEKIERVDENDMLRVAGTSEADPFYRVPLHIAEAMRTAKEQEVGEALARATPADAALDKAAWMASGYVKACAEFQRLWIALRRKGMERIQEEGRDR